MRSGSVVLVSAGNEGPSFGTVGWPGGRLSSLAVASYDYATNKISRFSSRGPLAGRLKQSISIMKPEIAVAGGGLQARLGDTCARRAGTSFSAVLLAGLLARKFGTSGAGLNQASALLLLREAAVPLPGFSMFEQGLGVLDHEALSRAELAAPGRLELVPSEVDLTPAGSDYFSPLNLQPIFPSQAFRFLNLTLVATSAENFRVFKVEREVFPWVGDSLEVFFEHSSRFRYVGFLAIKFRLEKTPGMVRNAVLVLTVTVQSIETSKLFKAKCRVKLEFSPRPPREKMLLFDDGHNLVAPFDGATVKSAHQGRSRRRTRAIRLKRRPPLHQSPRTRPASPRAGVFPRDRVLATRLRRLLEVLRTPHRRPGKTAFVQGVAKPQKGRRSRRARPSDLFRVERSPNSRPTPRTNPKVDPERPSLS